MHFAIILHGLNGSGKSTVAKILHQNLDFEVISFDTYWRVHNIRPDLATTKQRNTIYNEALRLALIKIKKQSVIIDCTSRSKLFRAAAVTLFQKNNCGVIFIVCKSAPNRAKTRVLERAISNPEHINTTSELYEAITKTFEPITETENLSTIYLDTNQFPSQVLSIKTKNNLEADFCTTIIKNLK